MGVVRRNLNWSFNMDKQELIHRFTFGDDEHTETLCGLWSAAKTTRRDYSDSDINCPECIERFNKAKSNEAPSQ